MYETMRFEEGEGRTTWSVVSKKLDNACTRRSSKHVTRDRFLQLKPESKSVDQFVVKLRKQVRDCEFGGCKMTSLIGGVSNKRMCRQLLERDNQDLPKAIRMCQIMEATATDLKSLVEKTETVEKVAAMESQLATVPSGATDPLTPLASKEGVLLIRVQKVGRKPLANMPFQREKKVQVITCQLDTAASCNVMYYCDIADSSHDANTMQSCMRIHALGYPQTGACGLSTCMSKKAC